VFVNFAEVFLGRLGSIDEKCVRWFPGEKAFFLLDDLFPGRGLILWGIPDPFFNSSPPQILIRAIGVNGKKIDGEFTG
jgi:hypothetical protein